MRSAASVVLRDVARAGGKLEVLGRGGAGVQTPTQRCRTTSRRARPPPPPLLLPAPLFTESRAIATRQPTHTHTHTPPTPPTSYLYPLPHSTSHVCPDRDPRRSRRRRGARPGLGAHLCHRPCPPHRGGCQGPSLFSSKTRRCRWRVRDRSSQGLGSGRIGRSSSPGALRSFQSSITDFSSEHPTLVAIANVRISQDLESELTSRPFPNRSTPAT
jgi:hypothetical protein